MSDRVSPLGADFRPGKFGNLANGVGITLSETFFDFVAEIAAFEGAEADVKHVVENATKIDNAVLFKIAANRWMTAGMWPVSNFIRKNLKPIDGSFIDLSHGRSAFVVAGPKAEWVLAKLYAIDFSVAAFPVGTGLSTTHHSIFTQIYRPNEETFDLFVFRSFARSFWHTLQRAAEETGYEVA